MTAGWVAFEVFPHHLMDLARILPDGPGAIGSRPRLSLARSKGQLHSGCASDSPDLHMDAYLRTPAKIKLAS